jgi:hypothetical protein
MERLDGSNVDHTKKMQVWKKVTGVGMMEDRSTMWEEPLLQSQDWAI